jgi:hypothetical protein
MFLTLTKSEGLPYGLVLLCAGVWVFRQRIVAALVPFTLGVATLLAWRSGVPPGDEEDFVARLPHLFDRFYRGHQALPRVSGTGMGLSIARGVLAVQRGRIWAENRPEGGAQFVLQVPAAVRAMDVPEQVS